MGSPHSGELCDATILQLADMTILNENDSMLNNDYNIIVDRLPIMGRKSYCPLECKVRPAVAGEPPDLSTGGTDRRLLVDGGRCLWRASVIPG